MAFSAHKNADQVKEHFEKEEEVERKAHLMANWIRQSQHFIAFTGAGISTSAGIPDFRGPEGAWTLQAQGRVRTLKTVNSLQAIPTPTHMSLVELQNVGLLKYLVSQNCDGLHRKSGIHPQTISELHGNSNREYCKSCGKEYIRDFRAVASYKHSVHDHRTGRNCGVCGDELHDSIINFQESLPIRPLQLAMENARRTDLCLVLGSSLTVSPANEIPHIAGSRRDAKLVIVNLQKTPLDSMASLRVFAPTDDFMYRVMDKLGLNIPPFLLTRRLVVESEKTGDRDGTKVYQMNVYGLDVDDTHASIIKLIEIGGGSVTSEPFSFRLAGTSTFAFFIVHFMGWYGEPPLEIKHPLPKDGDTQHKLKRTYLLEYNPREGGAWNMNILSEEDDYSQHN